MTTLELRRETAHDTTFPWATLLVVLAGAFVTVLDFFIVNVAVPDVQTSLHAGAAAVQLVIGGYGLALAVGLVTGGRLGDLHGRARTYRVGLALFTVASLACALAPTAGVLVAMRIVQGATAALVTPQVLALITATFGPEHRARAFQAYGLTLGLAGVLGQVIGGALLRWDPAGLGWRTIFLLNVPVGVAAVLAARRHVPESRGERTRLDLTGTAVLTLALTAVVLPLVLGREEGWPVWTWASLAAAGPLLVGFAVVERRAAYPLLDLALFRERAFSAGLGVALTFSLAQASFFFVLVLLLQDGRGMSPLGSGAMVGVLGLGFFAATVLAGPLAQRIGRQALAVGSGLTSAGYVLLAATVHAPTPALLPGLVVAGAGMGFVLAPISETVLARIPVVQAGSAAGVLSTALQLGGGLGVAALGAVFFARAGHGTAGAAELCFLVMAGATAGATLLVQLLPRR